MSATRVCHRVEIVGKQLPQYRRLTLTRGNAVLPLYQMPRHQNKLSVAARITFVLLAVTPCASGVFASKEPGSVAIKVHHADGTVSYFRTYPEFAVKLLFPKSEAMIEPDASPEKWKPSSATILKKIQTVRVSDTDRRFNVVGVTSGDQLFIFDGLFSDTNAVTMSQLIRSTASGPHDEAEALDLTKLYLALSYYRFADPDRLVAFRESESMTQNANSFSDMMRISHSPQIVKRGATYTLDFYSYDAPGAASTGVSHWQIKIGPDDFEERLSAHHDGFQQLHSKADSETTQPEGKVKFSMSMMANGFTEDGATTDIQTWGSSNGPGVTRIHYYYKSHEKAEKRMQDDLQNAVNIIETRPWLDSQGKSVGTQAMVIQISDKEKTLIASWIGQDESRVLQVSSISLGNLLAALHRELPDSKH